MTAYADKLNITSITDNVAPANSLALGYNKPNRLQSAAGPWGNKTFTEACPGAGRERHGQPHLRGDGCHNRHAELPGHLQPHLERAHRRHNHAHVHPRHSCLLAFGKTRATPAFAGAGIATDTRSGSTFTYGYNARGRLATVSQDGNPGLRRGRPQGHLRLQQHAP